MDWQALWDWLSDPNNRTVLAWLGGGVLAFVVAILSVIRRSNVVKADHGSVAAGRDAHVNRNQTQRRTRK